MGAICHSFRTLEPAPSSMIITFGPKIAALGDRSSAPYRGAH